LPSSLDAIASILAFGWTGSVADTAESADLGGSTINSRLRRRQRIGSWGQGLVEFAIVGGLLFFLIFSVMNAGFYLYGANAMQYAADIGVATIAAEGNYNNLGIPAPNNADTIAIARMDSDGLNSTPLVKVTQVDVYKESVTAGVFSDALCGGVTCENQYTASGALIGTQKWNPAVRNVGPQPDYAKLIIHFQYTLLIGTTTFNSTTVNLFRLEPQQ
jgi:Flp pilus assembly protein TadG